MSKNFDRYTGYDIGYGKTPAATRFSSSRQPARAPRRPPPRPKTTMRDLAQEELRVKQPDGTSIMVKGEQLMMEKMIAMALKGDISAARDLFARLDEEDDAWLAKPRYKVDRQRMKEFRAFLAQMTDPTIAERSKLEALGIVERVQGNEFCIAAWVRKAIELHKHRVSIAALPRRRDL